MAGQFYGSFNGIEWTPSAAVAANSVYSEGRFRGVTRQPFASGDTAIAFFPCQVGVWILPLSATASAAVTRGTEVQVNSDGKICHTGGAAVGALWKPIASGDTVCYVALYGLIPSGSVAAAVTCADDADATAVRTALRSVIANLTAAGLMANS